MNGDYNSESRPLSITQSSNTNHPLDHDDHGQGRTATERSRRKFLKTSLTGLAGTMIGAGMAGSVLAAPPEDKGKGLAKGLDKKNKEESPDEETITSPSEPTVINVRDYGASPAASPSQNVAAFQSAIDKAAGSGGGQTVFVPAGTYETDNPIYMRDYVTLSGEGATSHIRNIATKGISTNAIMMGDYHGRSFLEGNFLSIRPAMKYSLTLFFRTPSDSQTFAPGDLIILQSEEGFRGDHRPEFQEINEVVSTGPGTVQLKYPLHANLEGANPKVQRSGDTSNMSVRGNVARIVKGATIQKLKISSRGSWMSLGGAFECKIENLVLDSAAVMNVNGFARSVMRNIKANYWRRMIHLAYYCHHSIIEYVDATYREAYPDAPGEGINLGEASHNNIVRRINVNSKDAGGYRAAVQLGNSSDNEISDIQFKLTNSPDLYIVEFRGNLYKCTDNTVSGATVDWNGTLHDIIRVNPTNLTSSEKELVAGNKAEGNFNGKFMTMST